MKRSVTRYLPNDHRVLVGILLTCGIASSILYAITDFLAVKRWPGYDWTARMVSDLLAVSAPTRSFIVIPMLSYNLLIAAFAMGVWLRAYNRALRVTSIFLFAYVIVGVLGLVLFPLDYSVVGSGATMHMVATFTLIVLMFLFIGFAAAGIGSAFRIYSIATFAAILAGAFLAGKQIQRIEAHLPTPGLGLFERLNIYSMMLWVAVFALSLWKAEGGGPEPEVRKNMDTSR